MKGREHIAKNNPCPVCFGKSVLTFEKRPKFDEKNSLPEQALRVDFSYSSPMLQLELRQTTIKESTSLLLRICTHVWARVKEVSMKNKILWYTWRLLEQKKYFLNVF